jgi:serine/threonine protein kinase
MLHRDIKPTNILLTNDGGVFLADFGLVRLLDQTDLTEAGGIVGTLAYMAPEQLMGQKEEINYRADIYALGCVVYEMITGRPLFEPTSLLAAHFETKLPSPGLIVPALPEAASQVILKALAKNPAERPASASQFVEDLRRALNV